MLDISDRQELANSRILLTGAAGFIGSSILDSLIELDCEIIAVDALMQTTYSSRIKIDRWKEFESNKHNNLTLVHGDLRDTQLLKSLPPCDFVINQAAMPGLDSSWLEPESYIAHNLEVVTKLLQWAVENNVKRFVQASTSSVYGKVAISNEKSECLPISPYGVTKLAAENVIRAYSEAFELPFTNLRYFSVYGPRQRSEMAYSQFIKRIKRKEPLVVYGDGEQTRTNTYIDDIVKITLAATVTPEFANDTFNVSGPTEVSINQAIDVIAMILDSEYEVRYEPKKVGDQVSTKGDITKLSQKIDLLGLTTFDEGMRETIRLWDDR